jgi:diguanylate cyclase (GGDEF)-like protein/PAS domain S-box-containing protein
MSDVPDDELSHIMQFLYACPVGLVEFTADGTIGLVNPIAMQMLQEAGKTPFVANLFTAVERCSPELRNLTRSFTAPRGTVCENHRIFVEAGSHDGSVAPKVLSCTLNKLAEQRYTACLVDVSQQVVQERRLKQAETWFSTLLGDAEDFAVLALDDRGFIDSVRPALLEQTGLDEATVVGATLDLFDVADPDDIGPMADEMISVARRDGWHLDERWIRQADGGRRRCQRLVVVQTEHEGEGKILGFTAVLRTVAGPSFDADKLRRLLRTDHLTGAVNRAHFFDLAERAFQTCMRAGGTLSLLAIDLDRFKSINDTYGHATGDEVLQRVAAACRTLLRPADTFARLGGEEFVVLLPGVGRDEALKAADRIRGAVAALDIPTPCGPLRITASLGYATWDPSVTSVASLLAHADEALYAAKRAGRDRVCEFDPAVVLA